MELFNNRYVYNKGALGAMARDRVANKNKKTVKTKKKRLNRGVSSIQCCLCATTRKNVLRRVGIHTDHFFFFSYGGEHRA